jgi:hypothetical protein
MLELSPRECNKDCYNVTSSPSVAIYAFQSRCVYFLHFRLSLTCNELEDKKKKGLVKGNVEILLAFIFIFLSHSPYISQAALS